MVHLLYSYLRGDVDVNVENIVVIPNRVDVEQMLKEMPGPSYLSDYETPVK